MSDSNEIRRRLDELRTKAQEFAAAITDTLSEVNTLHSTGTTINLTDLHNKLMLTALYVVNHNGEYYNLDKLITIARFKLPPRL